jgi:hypothetical protein
VAATYWQYVEAALDAHEAGSRGARLAACVMEPGLQGAGGMLLVDPLFQRILAQASLRPGASLSALSAMRPALCGHAEPHNTASWLSKADKSVDFPDFPAGKQCLRLCAN